MAFTTTVGDVAEVVMRGTLASGGSSGKNVMSIFHYQLTVVGSAPTKSALDTIFDSTVSSALLAAYNQRYTQSHDDVRCVNDALDPYQSIIRAGVGAIATDSLPTLDCVTLLLRTTSRGRNYRGSKHFPGVNEADTTDDVLTGAGLARWQAVATAVAATLTDALGNSWKPCVLSRTLSQMTSNPTSIVATPVNQVLLNLNVGTMRSRRVATVR